MPHVSDESRIPVLVDAYATQHANLLANLVAALLGLWGPFTWWNRPDMVNAYAAQSAAYVDLANTRSRRLSRAYVTQQLRALDAMPESLPDIVDTYERGGTPIVEVYKRPARQREHAIRTGATEAEQVDVFTKRLEAIVEDDLARSARDEASRVLAASPKVLYYRRVIHPELSRTGTCGLCIVAADQKYASGKLMPLHGKCKCTIAIVTADADPGLSLNREDLKALYAAAGSTYAEDLKRIRVAVREHGELGPVLVGRGEHFRDVAEVNADAARFKFTPFERMDAAADARMWRGMRAQSERAIEILQDAKDMGTDLVDMGNTGRLVPVADIDRAIGFHRALITRAARHAA